MNEVKRQLITHVYSFFQHQGQREREMKISEIRDAKEPARALACSNSASEFLNQVLKRAFTNELNVYMTCIRHKQWLTRAQLSEFTKRVKKFYSNYSTHLLNERKHLTSVFANSSLCLSMHQLMWKFTWGFDFIKKLAEPQPALINMPNASSYKIKYARMAEGKGPNGWRPVTITTHKKSPSYDHPV